MHKTLSLSPAHRRTAAITLAVGAALGIVATAGIAAAAPAFASVPARAASVGAATFTANPAHTEVAIAAARTALTDAASTVIAAESSGIDLGAQGTAIDATPLVSTMAHLEDAENPSVLLLPALMTSIDAQTEQVAAQTAELRGRLDAATAQQAAEQAAQQAAVEAAASLANANTPDGAKAAARQIAADQYGWGDGEFSCLSSLWEKESGWNYLAYNDDGGATGIPQSLPGDKMASAGADWQTNAVTQVRWGLQYIQGSYGSPCAAWGHSQSMNWY
ncbi:outer membrane phospholipase A [Microbacterium sp. CH12i]|uniref:aggregation-promoting factor C-terminal-like domain-containing protein n=1 Tax=Microbacterium sp. CH12i TaxID=1479651 RepID=UPI000461D0B3|nr:hypothetical protein [Microbacterium sp. CH12i]KDA04990.1 outer membrane phospholipase A [Microbacterium sp. CH12i]